MKEQDEGGFYVKIFTPILIGLYVCLTWRMKLRMSHYQVVKNTNLKSCKGKANTQGREEIFIYRDGIVSVLALYFVIFTKGNETLQQRFPHFKKSHVHTLIFYKYRHSRRLCGIFPWRCWVLHVPSHVLPIFFSHVTLMILSTRRRGFKGGKEVIAQEWKGNKGLKGKRL